jgi:hypothetical protein
VLARIHLLATVLWGGLTGGAAAGLLARDALGLRQPLVALSWVTGAALGLLPLAGRRGRKAERGQATVEFTAIVLVVALGLGALVAVAPRFDGRSFGGFLAYRISCAIGRDCHGGDARLARAYGTRDAALVREHAPSLVYEPGERQLPVDWRLCRRPACAEAPDERELDVHRSDSGERATAFTRLLREAGRTYLQYWFYYPDSKTTWASSDTAWEIAWSVPRTLGLADGTPDYPGSHPDDWEAYAVRLDPDGRARVMASSHGHWQGCDGCGREWTARTGWTRVSRGSHAGHIPVRYEVRPGAPAPLPRQLPPRGAPRRLRGIAQLPGHDLDERTTTGEGLRLIPLETMDAGGYRPRDEEVEPPWQKEAYWDPESGES